MLNSTADSAVRALERRNILSGESVFEDNDRQFEVCDTQYHGSRPLESLRLETRLVYEFLNRRNPGDIVTQQELKDYVVSRVQEIDPERDPADVRRFINERLIERAAGRNELPGFKRLGHYNGDDDTRTRITFNTNYQEALGELMDYMVGILDADERLLALGLQSVSEIVQNPDSVFSLMDKAKSFSANANSRSASEYHDQVLDFVKERGRPCTTSEILEHLPLNIGVHALHAYLSKWSGKDGSLVANPQCKSTNDSRKVLAYSPAVSE